MEDEYDFSNEFSNDFSEDFNKAGDNAPPPPRPREEKELNKNLPASDKNNLRSMLSMPLAGGTISPAKIGNTYGVRWSAQFAKGGKVKDKTTPKASSASRRGDGIAQRGKTRGRMV
jgi:hypothetical protein